MADKSNMDRAAQIANQIGRRARDAGRSVADEIKKLPVEETISTLGDAATQTGRRMRKVAGRLSRDLRKRIKR